MFESTRPDGNNIMVATLWLTDGNGSSAQGTMECVGRHGARHPADRRAQADRHLAEHGFGRAPRQRGSERAEAATQRHQFLRAGDASCPSVLVRPQQAAFLP
jgi:hypothetical protein